jgi:D-sedoheptulose 7-phosphate isomerase
MIELSSTEQTILDELVENYSDYKVYEPQLLKMHQTLVDCFDRGGTLFLCGNGGSFSDAVHIAGELCKSFERKRPIPPQLVEKLHELPFGKQLGEHLEAGLRAVALGLNGSLKTAIENDSPVRDIAFAQELNVLARRGDVLLSLSTSGHATNCLMAMSTAKAKGCVNLALLGREGGDMLELADVAILAPGKSTRAIQEAHIVIWHRICLLIEAHYFPILRD